jgi:hypothetical protein
MPGKRILLGNPDLIFLMASLIVIYLLGFFDGNYPASLRIREKE